MPTVHQSIAVSVPLTTAYQQWTRFEEFPEFMADVDEVRWLDDTRLHWVAGTGGRRREWETEIVERAPEERVTWRHVDGSQTASVTFQRIHEGRTRLMMELDFRPEGVVEQVSSALGSPERRIRRDLEAFKDFVETRERW